MNKRLSIVVGIALILMGTLAVVFNLAVPMLGLNVWRWGAWRLWPLLVVALGLLLVVSPLCVRGKRGLGGLFIPGVPILTAGGILLYASTFDAWGAWARLWPLEALAVAAGFLFAAIYMRSIWLITPAVIIGANGLVLQFCTLTHLWEMWAVLWTVEPLSVGLSLLVISAGQRSAGLFMAGLVLCSLAGGGLIGMTAIMPQYGYLNLLGPVLLMLVGLSLLIWGTVRPPSSAELAAD
jgi:hypothetical protein